MQMQCQVLPSESLFLRTFRQLPALAADAGFCLRTFCPDSFCQIDAPQRRCLFSDFQNRLSVCALFARFDRNQTLIWLYRCKRLFQSGNDAQLA